MCVENIIFNLLATLPQSHAERMFHIRRPRGWVKISCHSHTWDIYMCVENITYYIYQRLCPNLTPRECFTFAAPEVG